MVSNIILGIDPGLNTGWAQINPLGKIVDMGQILYEDLPEWLTKLSIDDVAVFVVENFRIRPEHNFSWNEMKTIRAIGMVELRAYQLEAQLIFQEPERYVVGAKWAGVEIPKDHSISHQVVAYAHATYYSVHTLGNMPPGLVQSVHEEAKGLHAPTGSARLEERDTPLASPPGEPGIDGYS